MNASDSQWRCVFVEKGTRSVDDVIQVEHKALKGTGAPWSAIQRIWRRQHCQTLNPYGDSRCPYARGECLREYETAVRRSFLDATIQIPIAFFSRVARNAAARRADHATATDRNRDLGGRGPAGRARGVAGVGYATLVRRVDEPTTPRRVRRADAAPRAIGDLLRPSDRGPRQGAAQDGPEGSE